MGQVKYAIRRQCQTTSDKSAYSFIKTNLRLSNRACVFQIQRPPVVYFSIFPVPMLNGLIPLLREFPRLTRTSPGSVSIIINSGIKTCSTRLHQRNHSEFSQTTSEFSGQNRPTTDYLLSGIRSTPSVHRTLSSTIK